jgi:hypothetical protein
MGLDTALSNARALAEALMMSACTIREPGGEAVTDPDTGEVTFPDGATVYSGKCRIRQPGNWGTLAEAGGEQIAPGSYQISVPFAASTVERGHVVTVDASTDPQLVGRKFEVRFTPVMGDISARRLICEEAS